VTLKSWSELALAEGQSVYAQVKYVSLASLIVPNLAGGQKTPQVRLVERVIFADLAIFT
jgi:hypothetical protein